MRTQNSYLGFMYSFLYLEREYEFLEYDDALGYSAACWIDY